MPALRRMYHFHFDYTVVVLFIRSILSQIVVSFCVSRVRFSIFLAGIIFYLFSSRSAFSMLSITSEHFCIHGVNIENNMMRALLRPSWSRKSRNKSAAFPLKSEYVSIHNEVDVIAVWRSQCRQQWLLTNVILKVENGTTWNKSEKLILFISHTLSHAPLLFFLLSLGGKTQNKQTKKQQRQTSESKNEIREKHNEIKLIFDSFCFRLCFHLPLDIDPCLFYLLI